jgi:hypothetical protein
MQNVGFPGECDIDVKSGNPSGNFYVGRGERRRAKAITKSKV